MKSNQNKDLLAKKTLLMAERTYKSMQKVSNGTHPTTWLLLQPDLIVFLLSRNVHKTCAIELKLRAPHQAVADDMAKVATIETESIVLRMLALGFSYWLEPSVVDLYRGMEIDLHRGMGITRWW